MVFSYKEFIPNIHESVFVAPSADIIGDIIIGKNSSVWFNVTIRADVHFIRIGESTNVQDNSILHVTNGVHPLIIEDNVTIGHNVSLHGCTIGNTTLIGIGAIVLDDAEIGENSIVGAGSLVRESKKFPPGVLIAGSPAEIKRDLKDYEIQKNKLYATNYIEYSQSYLDKDIFKIYQRR